MKDLDQDSFFLLYTFIFKDPLVIHIYTLKFIYYVYFFSPIPIIVKWFISIIFYTI